MDLDNITDVEFLKNELKKYMIQMKKDAHANDGTNYLFRKGFWYYFEQDEVYVTIYSDDREHECFFSYEEAERFLVKN